MNICVLTNAKAIIAEQSSSLSHDDNPEFPDSHHPLIIADPQDCF